MMSVYFYSMRVDHLIIGQGISGTWLSYFLQKENKSFLVIDNNLPNASSRVSAGVINPVTGRRIVKTWMIDELLTFLKSAYSEMENKLGIDILSPKPIIDFFPTPQMREAFLERRHEESFLQIAINPEEFRNQFNYDFGWGSISPAYIVDLGTLLPAWRKKLSDSNQLIDEYFDLNLLKISENNISYKEIVADKIIFCDGVNSLNNPLFSRLPFAFNKGETLLIEAEGISQNYIYKKGIAIAPLQPKNLFWAGTNYIWDFRDDLPSKEFRIKTEQQLKQWLKIPFKILNHRASVRPANVERRPFVGMHPVHKNVGILNGMGSKGCSLSPYFANQMVNHLIHKSEILPEADIKRFTGILSK